MKKPLRIGINGFGRIGRNAARIIASRDDVVVSGINSSSGPESHAYLLTHDSAQGRFDVSVGVDGENLTIGDTRVSVFTERDPSGVPWKRAGVDLVLECTGKFRDNKSASAHLQGGVSRVVISAPAKDQTPTYVVGVNHETYKGEAVVSNSSCTTNCISTVVKVLHDALGVVNGNMTTIHAATDSQNLLDNSHKKEVRQRRSTLGNLIPASSGSSKDLAKLFPHLAGLLPCRAIRVPIPTVSLIDLVVTTSKQTDRDTVNGLFTRAARGPMHGILAVAEEELVSVDYIGNPHSSVIDPFLTDVVGGNLIHVTAWYDNEWGYANRLVDLAYFIGSRT